MCALCMLNTPQQQQQRQQSRTLCCNTGSTCNCSGLAGECSRLHAAMVCTNHMCLRAMYSGSQAGHHLGLACCLNLLRDEACYSGIAVGRTCSAECSIEYDYSGPGYTSTCKPDGTWSKPSGSCQSDFANTIQCEDDCQVANCDGCKCGEDVITGDPACQCNARQGFIDWPYT